MEGEGPRPGKLAYNQPGATDGFARPETDTLTAWTAVHLHGGHQNGLSDGATEYGVTPGNSQLSEYANDQAAAHLFYHDHAMSVTTLNVMSGLVGNYVIRDDEEDRLDLPRGRYEVPLTIADVNFDTDSRGLLTGRLLAKRVLAGGAPRPGAIPRSLPFFGPFTMVNGVVWPHFEVEARSYRFRVVNVSPNRAYRLVVIDGETGAPVRGAMTLIGTDLGLLDTPRPIETLSLSSAERADVVIDFGAYPGQRLKLVNTVAGQPAGAAVPAANIPHPEVMEFRIAERRQPTQRIPAMLSRDFRRLTLADVPSDAVERFVLTAYDKSGVMPQLWEMQDVGHGIEPRRWNRAGRDARWPANPAPCRHGIRRRHHLLRGGRHLGEVELHQRGDPARRHHRPPDAHPPDQLSGRRSALDRRRRHGFRHGWHDETHHPRRRATGPSPRRPAGRTPSPCGRTRWSPWRAGSRDKRER